MYLRLRRVLFPLSEQDEQRYLIATHCNVRAITTPIFSEPGGALTALFETDSSVRMHGFTLQYTASKNSKILV